MKFIKNFAKTYLKPALQCLIRNIFSPPKILTDLPTNPISQQFGLERGQPVDRFYIESFLSNNAQFIKGRVVEIAENTYTLKFGTAVEKSEILHIDKNDKKATIIADLSDVDTIPENIADSFICTQTLNFIYDVKKAIKGIHKILKPNGKAIITVAGLSQISRFDMDRWGDYWRFTDRSLKKLLMESFNEADIQIEIFGNVHSATMFLQGIASEELDKHKIEVKDHNYQIVLGAIVTKRAPEKETTTPSVLAYALNVFLVYIGFLYHSFSIKSKLATMKIEESLKFSIDAFSLEKFL
jgi:SAM-dependent methyltransferase